MMAAPTLFVNLTSYILLHVLWAQVTFTPSWCLLCISDTDVTILCNCHLCWASVLIFCLLRSLSRQCDPDGEHGSCGVSDMHSCEDVLWSLGSNHTTVTSHSVFFARRLLVVVYFNHYAATTVQFPLNTVQRKRETPAALFRFAIVNVFASVWLSTNTAQQQGRSLQRGDACLVSLRTPFFHTSADLCRYQILMSLILQR